MPMLENLGMELHWYSLLCHIVGHERMNLFLHDMGL